MKPPLSNGTLAEPDHADLSPNNRDITPRYPREVPEPRLNDGFSNQAVTPGPVTPGPVTPGPVTPITVTPEPVARGNPLISNLIFLLAGALIACAGIFVTRQPTAPPIQIQPPPTIAPTATPNPTPTPEPMTVFVSGAVQSPGLYKLLDSARVGDVLQMAGGLLPEAEAALINQAERLFDGAQVHVPSAIQVVEVEPATAIDRATDGAGDRAGSPSPLLSNQPQAGISGATGPSQPSANSGSSNLINVNTATAAELETLPSVGASRAAEIIAGRPYATVDELQKVSGIGAKTVEKLRPLVRVE